MQAYKHLHNLKKLKRNYRRIREERKNKDLGGLN